jgi:arginase
MPIRHLCGEGDKKIGSTGFCCINPKSLVYMGARDLDPPEIQWMKEEEIPIFNHIPGLLGFLNEQKFKKIFVHLDLDVIDSSEFSSTACPVADGLSVKQIVLTLDALSKNYHVVGATLTECVAKNECDLRPILPILKWWERNAHS